MVKNMPSQHSWASDHLDGRRGVLPPFMPRWAGDAPRHSCSQLLLANTAHWIGSGMDAAEPRFCWEAPRCGTTIPQAALPTVKSDPWSSWCPGKFGAGLETFGIGTLSASSVLGSPGDTSQVAWPCSGQHQAGQIKLHGQG